jgi:hypothetical protein
MFNSGFIELFIQAECVQLGDQAVGSSPKAGGQLADGFLHRRALRFPREA